LEGTLAKMPYPTPNGTEGKGSTNILNYTVRAWITIGN
jgi:hypothetical protein